MARTATINVSIQAAASTVLGQIAQAMPSRSWVYLNNTVQYGVNCTTPTGFADHIIRQGGPAASNWDDLIFNWGNRMSYSPVAGTIELIAAGSHTSIPRSTRYILSSHSFDSATMTNAEGGNHLFDQLTANPYTNQQYLRKYGNAGDIARWASGAGSYPVITTCPDISNIMAPAEWWSGSITGGGAQGLLVVANCYNSITVNFYNPLTPGWLSTSVGSGWPGASGGYNNAGAYSAVKNCMIFGGANNSTNSLWKIDSTRTVTKYAASAPINVGVASANMIADPITGNFLILHGPTRAFYEFNPDGAGTWTALSGSSTPPNGSPTLGTVYGNLTSGSGATGVASITDLGVTVWISQSIGTAFMHVYKHGV